MNRTLSICLIMALSLIASACGRVVSSSTNEENRRYFEAWAKVNIPEAGKTALGSYIIEESVGSGVPIADSAYIRCHYTIRSLDGTIASSTYEKIAQQIGTYDTTSTYVPQIWGRSNNALYAGLEELLEGRRVGMKVKAAVPGWLITSDRYSTAEEYLKSSSDAENRIYEIEIVDAFGDVEKFEMDSLLRYLGRNYPQINTADTVNSERNKYGLYYLMEKKSDAPDTTYEDNAKLYLNYVGRLLNGKVFDTNIERVAKDAGIYNSSGSYNPVTINWSKEDYSKITMGSDESSSSSTIDGFAYAVHKMKPHEKGRVFFISAYGYSSSGSGSSIPAFSPLIFELELVDNDE